MLIFLYVFYTQPTKDQVFEFTNFQFHSQICFRASRVRREFGAPVTFTDRDADITATDQGLSASYLVCQPYSEGNFNIKKLEMDRAVQAVAEITDGSSQTQW